jgi:cytochrome c553
VRIKRLRSLGWLVIVAMPLAAHGASNVRREFDAVIHSKPDKVHGEKLFEVCAACHGRDGGGTQDGRVPAIANQRFRVIAKELVDFRHDQRWDALMEHYSDEHNLGDTQNLADVAAYISELTPVSDPGVGDGKFLRDGAIVYSRSCASCHGATAEGDNARRNPRLAGQHYAYLLRQMHDAVDGRRPNFSRAHVRLLARLERSDFEGLADYLSRAGRREGASRH